ncbi:uncharacterized protein LOC111713141 isoform X3 [Eurytemora carolleeae]|uniref:uncharacterized protein LOC111713141 isoform X3 n=1 Tax=Eurytemora carolleeae TaxID=1294199 RepID=UPI000C76377D|nr:uncharacterized protein LOC111713141 isoform X3 [Eurytemora carolleeae]|eukprot:XP_023343714.1 uncharacterized protein LOC111713141 isoform X3 [Eurytemora affinis]
MPLSQEVQNRLATLDHQMKKKELTQKDLEFQEMMKALEMESAARVHSVRSKKKELRVFQRQTNKKVEKMKQERKAEYCTSNATREKIAETYRNMELSSKAQNFEDPTT